MTSPWIRHINNESELNQLIDTKPVVMINFSASWCPPSNMINPTYCRLANEFRTVTFTKVDVDRLQLLATEYNARNLPVGCLRLSLSQPLQVSAMPTFVVIKDREEVGRQIGAYPEGLRSLVSTHAPKADESSGAPASSVSLLEYLDLSQANCLNEKPDHTLTSIVGIKVRNFSAAYLESDADEQLLISLPFNQIVRVRSIVIHTKEAQKGPKDIKVDINKPSIGFSDIEDAKEPAVVQEITVPEDFVAEGKHIHLRLVRLQQVSSLHIFVSSNHGGVDETRIDSIDVFGEPSIRM
ncbi:hypothetical protein FS837_001868 [Tulasnella sp. UAMH 9824]|nr:hypothetical protein FS837_001868 [Tulasnella sp. UAMH 9824]